jgi:hypothetical protein
MTDNLYQTPVADVDTNVAVLPKPKTGIFIAVIVDMVSTFIITIIAGVLYAYISYKNGMAPEEIMKLGENIDAFGAFSLGVSFLGLLVSVIAGYVCARIAKIQIYKNAVIAAAIVYALSELITIGSKHYIYTSLLGLTTFVAMLFGAWLFAKTRTN